MSERWLPLPGWEGLYEVSDRGRIRSLDREVLLPNGGRRLHKGRVLKADKKAGGHLYVMVQDGDDNKKHQYVHRAVLHAFVGPPPFDGALCCHRDDDPSNNLLENLYWGTYSDNRLDEVANGRNYNRNRTACPKGHPFDSENTIRYRHVGDGRPRRACRTCRNAYRRRRRAERRSAAHSTREAS